MLSVGMPVAAVDLRRGRIGFAAATHPGSGVGRIRSMLIRMRSTGLVASVDPREYLADRHRHADLHEDLGHAAADWRRDLGLDLVGRDLDDRLVALDPITGAFLPV